MTQLTPGASGKVATHTLVRTKTPQLIKQPYTVTPEDIRHIQILYPLAQEGMRAEFSDRHEVVKTVCVWRDGTCYRIEIIKRLGTTEKCAFVALLWTEEKRDGTRALVRDVTFPWVHHVSAESALDCALESLAAKLRYPSTGDKEV